MSIVTNHPGTSPNPATPPQAALTIHGCVTGGLRIYDVYHIGLHGSEVAQFSCKLMAVSSCQSGLGLTHTDSKSVLAVDKRPASHHVDCSMGLLECPLNMTATIPQPGDQGCNFL
jgi:hypothetical protein